MTQRSLVAKIVTSNMRHDVMLEH